MVSFLKSGLVLSSFFLISCAGAGGGNVPDPVVGETTKASVEEELERAKQEIQILQGAVDGLVESVRQGELVGEEADPSAPSMRARMEGLEREISEMKRILLPEPEVDQAPVTEDSAEAEKLTVEQLQELFNREDYTAASEQAKRSLSGTDGAEKKKIMAIYAESLYRTGDFKTSALTYDELQNDADYDKIAKLRIGQCFKQLGDEGTAALFFEDLLEKYPGSKEAKEYKASIANNSQKDIQ